MANASLEDPNTCLLRYLMSTEPTPVQTGGDLRLDTSVSTPANATVYCNKIVLAFPVDSSDPAALYASAPISSLSNSNWEVTSSVRTGEELGMGIFDVEYTTFIYTCSPSQFYQINYNLVFGAFGPVSPATGSTKIFVKETSGTTSDPGRFTDKTCSLDIERPSSALYAGNTGFGPALSANNYSIWASIMTANETSDANHTTGIHAHVATPSDSGLTTNGLISTSSGDSVLTHVPTRNGHRVVTSPVALESELHASGEGRLEQGRARIGFLRALPGALAVPLPTAPPE